MGKMHPVVTPYVEYFDIELLAKLKSYLYKVKSNDRQSMRFLQN